MKLLVMNGRNVYHSDTLSLLLICIVLCDMCTAKNIGQIQQVKIRHDTVHDIGAMIL